MDPAGPIGRVHQVTWPQGTRDPAVKPTRGPYLRREQVVITARSMYASGADFAAVAEALGCSFACLKSALERAGEKPLLSALRNRRRWRGESPHQIAVNIISLLSQDEIRDLHRRCLDRLQADREPVQRKVRGAGGVVKWTIKTLAESAK